MTPLQLMLARHAVEIAECPIEHAEKVAIAHMFESFEAYTRINEKSVKRAAGFELLGFVDYA